MMMKYYVNHLKQIITQIFLIFPIIIIWGLESGKTNVLMNLIKHQRPDIEKTCLFVKDPFESKYQISY